MRASIISSGVLETEPSTTRQRLVSAVKPVADPERVEAFSIRSRRDLPSNTSLPTTLPLSIRGCSASKYLAKGIQSAGGAACAARKIGGALEEAEKRTSPVGSVTSRPPIMQAGLQLESFAA